MGTSSPTGLRERKQQQTRQRIMEAALRLFASDGYEATSVEAVAEAADVSRRSFFHYFASKDDILASWQAGMPDLLRAALDAQPDGVSPLQMLRTALSELPAAFDREQALAINRIIRASDQLRAGNSAKMIRLEQVAFDALRARFGTTHDEAGLRMTAMVAVGAVRLALDEWTGGDGREPAAGHIMRAFDALTAVLPRP